MKQTPIYQPITAFINTLQPSTISENRKQQLAPLILFIKEKVAQKKLVNLNFICTHNSRRSHLTQIWAKVMATYFTIPNVVTYSGGTEATALYEAVRITLINTGFKVQALSQEKNPIYSIKYGAATPPIIGFSKQIQHPFNPSEQFAAIMTCSQADEGCPFVAGAEKRIPVTYEDPKAFDNTSQQLAKYQERSMQIATEMYYVFSCCL